MAVNVRRYDWVGRSRLEYSARAAVKDMTEVVAPQSEEFWLIERQTGWPFRAMANYYAATIVPDEQSPIGSSHVPLSLNRYHSGLEVRHHPFGLTAANYASLPFVPLWPGFIANTALYGFGLFLLLSGPAVLRRHRRTRHGLCVECAYPTTGLNRCPECGTAVASSAKPPAPAAEPTGSTPVLSNNARE